MTDNPPAGVTPPTGHTDTTAAAPPPLSARTPRVFRCRCERPIFFRNSTCLGCGTALGYDAAGAQLLPIEPATDDASRWVDARGSSADHRLWWRCAELDSAAACNWLVPATDTNPAEPLRCACCQLLRTRPVLDTPSQIDAFTRIERARRRLVSSLIGLGLPVAPRLSGQRPYGMAFDVLASLPGAPRVVTGHDDGVITVDLDEADDAVREQRRTELREPYRTMLGHLRHESGHYYWQRLVDGSDWLLPYRALFGDEQQDYAGSLKRHYDQGAPGDWSVRFVSAYASAHPWEDFAETWAHYLHLLDTLDTARSFGLDASNVELQAEPFAADALAGAVEGDTAADREQFVERVRDWNELTAVLNELARSMGVNDIYPFVLSAAAVRKLYFVHRLVTASGLEQAGAAQ